MILLLIPYEVIQSIHGSFRFQYIICPEVFISQQTVIHIQYITL